MGIDSPGIDGEGEKPAAQYFRTVFHVEEGLSCQKRFGKRDTMLAALLAVISLQPRAESKVHGQDHTRHN